MIQTGGAPLLCIFWPGFPSGAYSSAKSKNKFHLWGSHWRHGDSLLFALASAQIMYAFVMRLESLPKSYQDFIQKTGPVAKPVYNAVMDCCRGGSVDVGALSSYLSDKKNANILKLEEFPSIITCSFIHPNTNSCLAHNAKATTTTFKKTFPLYFSLKFVPFVMLRLQKMLLLAPGTAVKGEVRSTTFLSAFVGLFQREKEREAADFREGERERGRHHQGRKRRERREKGNHVHNPQTGSFSSKP